MQPIIAMDSFPAASGRFDLVGHSFRVAAFSVELARRWDVGAPDLRHIYLGGLFHDVGKLFLPSVLFAHGDTLAPEQTAQVRRHPELGSTFLARTGAPAAVAELVANHHERWDGGGYPCRTAGEDVPLGARIIAVADTYDAITSHRLYRPARSHAMATIELERAADEQLDPALVPAFLAIPITRLLAISASRPAPELFRRLLDVGLPAAGQAQPSFESAISATASG